MSQSPADLPSTYFDGSSRVVNHQVDFALARTWLDRCNDEHHCFVASKPKAPHLDRVIDCLTRELVSWMGQEYVALSYVWGSRSPITIEEDARTRKLLQLPSKVPLTIEDAINATLAVGRRYLWVDRYCVDQFHSIQKFHQLKAMADVYEQATVTIVALSDDADVGLYGMSAARHTDQIVLQSSTRTYASTLPDLQHCLERSVYKTRAWTYQEAALSRRCLIFAPTQVHFTCRSHTVCESLPLPFAKSWRACLRNPSALPWSRSIGPANSYRQKIEWLNSSIREFLLRGITYETDSLNAFRGMLARSELLTLYGLPVQHLTSRRGESKDHAQMESNFLQSLLWIQNRTVQSAFLSRHGVEDISNSKLRFSFMNSSKEDPEWRSNLGYSSFKQQFEKSLLRKEGMPTWSWVSCKSHDVDVLSSTTLHAEYGRVWYSSTVFIEDIAGRIQIAPHRVACDSTAVSEATSFLVFEDSYIIKGIDPKPCVKHFHNIISARHYISPSSHFRKLDGMSILSGQTDTFWLNPRGGVWIHIDREAGPELRAVAAGEATLDAILLEVRSNEPLMLKDGLPYSTEEGTRLMANPSARWSRRSRKSTIQQAFPFDDTNRGSNDHVLYNFLLICQSESQPAVRVGVLRLTLWIGLEFLNPKALSQSRVILA